MVVDLQNELELHKAQLAKEAQKPFCRHALGDLEKDRHLMVQQIVTEQILLEAASAARYMILLMGRVTLF